MDPIEDPTVQTTIYLPTSLRAWLEMERRRHNLTMTQYVRRLVEAQRDKLALVARLNRGLGLRTPEDPTPRWAELAAEYFIPEE